ncbi:MAG: PspA/IM30 family protein [Candidatus Competibacteraceae bacterium]|nr:PspA/IM30 family protein [Candidatus Competibacteraceae bacterium]
MKFMNNISLILRSSITALEEKVQDPGRMLQQLIIDMEEELERVRTSVAGAIADEIQLKKSCQRAREEADHWLERASNALERGDEAQSEAALAQKLRCAERADGLEKEYAKQQSQVLKLQDAVRDLEDKIRQARQKQTLLQARMVRAQSQQNINQALDASTRKSAFAQFSRLEQQVEREEAMTQAYDRLEGRDPDAEELDREFAEQERKTRLKEELAALKRRLNDEKTG